MAKERMQNPACGDTVTLRLFVYNSNAPASVESVVRVDIYFLDPHAVTSENPDGRTLVESVPGTSVTQDDTGKYSLELALTHPLYTIGRYVDSWVLNFEDTDCDPSAVENTFSIYPDLWFTAPQPPVYDFNFTFTPNKIVKGSKRHLIIRIWPNVPKGSDIEPYYTNLAIVSDLRVSVSLACGACVPEEEDLRLVVDRELVSHREKQYGYFYIDTTDYDEGIYDVWFELSFGENLYISPKNQLQIHK